MDPLTHLTAAWYVSLQGLCTSSSSYPPSRHPTHPNSTTHVNITGYSVLLIKVQVLSILEPDVNYHLLNFLPSSLM